MRNKILLGITDIAFILLMLSCASMDSESIIPIATLLMCGAWLILFSMANKEYYEKEDD